AERKAAIALATQLDSLARRLRTDEYRLVADSVLVRTALYERRFTDSVRLMQHRLARRPHRKAAVTNIAYGPDPAIVASSHSAIGLWFLGYCKRPQAVARAAVVRARESGHFLTLAAVLMQAALVELLCRNTGDGTDLAAEAVSVSAEQGFAFWNA